jgi:hypothetical protein
MSMFKKVLLAGALLAPVLAYGASPSTDLSVQIVPAISPTSPSPPTSSNGIACAVGPNYTGSVPAGASAAGFTTCAANFDFTQSFFATMSNWLDCAGASSPMWWLNSSGQDCSDFIMTTDQGVQVLDFHLPQGQTLGSDGFLALNTATSNYSTASLTIPQGKYYEVTFRVLSATATGGPGGNIIADAWSWCCAGGGTPPFVEYDFIEMYSSNPGQDGAGTGPWNGGGWSWNGSLSQVGNQPGYNPAVYNTYGIRVTTDGNGKYAECTYLNNNFVGCQTATALPSAEEAHNFLSLWGSPVGASVTGDTYWQSIRVWECSGWATGECNGTVLSGSP